MSLIPWIVLGSAFWVVYDAEQLGVKSGSLGGGVLDMGRWGWFFACLLLWIVAFPAYLIKRSEYINLKAIKKLKECHFCAEMIKAQANICRYCGRDV